MKKIAFIAGVSSLLFGFEFQNIGFKAIGMGGAGVASSYDSFSSYYNPALLAQYKRFVKLYLDIGNTLREVNLINPIDNLANKYQLSKTIDTIKEHAPISGSNDEETRNNIKGALTELYRLSDGNGLELQPRALFSAQIASFEVGIYSLSDIRANAFVDKNHLYLIFKDEENGGYYYYYPDTDVYGATDEETYKKYSLEYALDNRLTYLDIRGISLLEVPISYARGYSFNNFNLDVGLNLKFIQGTTYHKILAVDSDEDEIQNSIDKNSKTTSNFGVDVGVLLSSDKIKIGLVGKYLNAPKFEYKDGGDYKIEPMARMGVAYVVNDYINVSMDIDLTENKTLIQNYNSQYIGGGAEFKLKDYLSLRLGAMRNMVEDDEGLIVTSGLSLGLKWIKFDLSAQVSTKTGHFNGTEIPRYTNVNLAFISNWGGKD